jgi:hypothetical protein
MLTSRKAAVARTFIPTLRYYAYCVSTCLTVLVLYNVESVYFLYSNPVLILGIKLYAVENIAKFSLCLISTTPCRLLGELTVYIGHIVTLLLWNQGDYYCWLLFRWMTFLFISLLFLIFFLFCVSLLLDTSLSLVYLLLPLIIFCSISSISVYPYILVYARESVSKATDYRQENQGLIPSKGSEYFSLPSCRGRF